jgi:cytochrome c
MVGPAWRDIAAKYKGEKGAVASLGGKIIAGGKGVWGPVPMPPNPKITEAEAKELAVFIMGLAK